MRGIFVSIQGGDTGLFPAAQTTSLGISRIITIFKAELFDALEE